MGCHGWVRDAQVGYQIERQTLSRCKSRQRAVRMRNGISAGKALDQANLRSRIPEHRPLGAQPARQHQSLADLDTAEFRKSLISLMIPGTH